VRTATESPISEDRPEFFPSKTNFEMMLRSLGEEAGGRRQGQFVVKAAWRFNVDSSTKKIPHVVWNDEIRAEWCLGLSTPCTTTEAIGLYSVVLFYVTILITTAIHSAVLKQSQDPMTPTTAATTTTAPASSFFDDFQMLCFLLVYFFTFAAGCLLWVLHPSWVRLPLQSWPIQILGSMILWACLVGFITVHIQLGDSWYPVPDAPPQLVTHGLFQYARHPLYAIFLWGAVGTLLATWNWVIAWCVSGSVMVENKDRRTHTPKVIWNQIRGLPAASLCPGASLAILCEI
jgi:protein-S-isoprenylcysteine O-methyltransferase Ste14